MSSAIVGNQAGQGGGDFLDVSAVWRHKGWVIASVLGCVALGLVYLQQAKSIYESQARVLIQQQDLLNAAQRVRSDAEFLATQAEIIRSPVIIEKALKTVPVAIPADSDLDPVLFVLKGLKVSPIEKTNVLNISFRGSDREMGNKLVNTIVSCYAEFMNSTEATRASDSLRLMRQREETLRARLASLQQKHQELRKDSPQIGQGRDAMNLPMATLKDIGSQLAATGTRRMELENRLRVSASFSKLMGAPATLSKREVKSEAIADASGVTPVSTTVASAYPFVPDESSQAPPAVVSLADGTAVATADPAKIQEHLWRVKGLAMDLAQVYGPRHPEVRALQQQITLWEKRVAESQLNSTAAIAVELEALKVAEHDLAEKYREEMVATRKLDSFLFQEQQIVDDIARVDQSYKATMEAMTQMEMAAQALDGGAGSLTVRVLESPDLVENLVWPVPAQFLGLCAVVGFLGSSVLLVLFQKRPQGAVA